LIKPWTAIVGLFAGRVGGFRIPCLQFGDVVRLAEIQVGIADMPFGRKAAKTVTSSVGPPLSAGWADRGAAIAIAKPARQPAPVVNFLIFMGILR